MGKNNQLKVLFLYLDDTLPSSRIRVFGLKELIWESGIDCSFKKIPRNFFAKLFLLGKLKKYDIVFLQKKLLNYFDQYFFFKYSNKVVFDFDDAIYYRDNEKNDFRSKSRSRRFKSIIKKSNAVIAGNSILAMEAEKYNNNIIVLPSPVPVKDIDIKSYEIESERIVVGWVGGRENLIHFNLISAELKKLSNEYNFELHIISDGKLEIEGVNIVNIPWSISVQKTEIAKFDIGLMPLFDNPWTQGKCGYKALQYMASAVPTICSNVGANADMIDQGVNGFKADNCSDYYQYLKRLFDDKKLRQMIGENARKKILSCCSNEVIVSKLVKFLQEI